MNLYLDPADWEIVADALEFHAHDMATTSQAPELVFKTDLPQWQLAQGIRQALACQAPVACPAESAARVMLVFFDANGVPIAQRECHLVELAQEMLRQTEAL